MAIKYFTVITLCATQKKTHGKGTVKRFFTKRFPNDLAYQKETELFIGTSTNVKKRVHANIHSVKLLSKNKLTMERNCEASLSNLLTDEQAVIIRRHGWHEVSKSGHPK